MRVRALDKKDWYILVFLYLGIRIIYEMFIRNMSEVWEYLKDHHLRELKWS